MANFVVLHLEKAKGADAKMSAHIERTFIAGNVDESRIHLDREMIAFPDGVKSRSAAIEHRIENAKLKRKVGKKSSPCHPCDAICQPRSNGTYTAGRSA